MAVFRKAYVNVTSQIDISVISHDIKRVVTEANLPAGMVQILIPSGTSAVAMLENDPKIYEDYKKWIENQIPATSEKRPDRRSGSGRNYAHLRAQLVGHSLQLPVFEGKLQISPWQEILFFDFDDKPGRREYFILVAGEMAATAGGGRR